jgi:hypothetical protein
MEYDSQRLVKIIRRVPKVEREIESDKECRDEAVLERVDNQPIEQLLRRPEISLHLIFPQLEGFNEYARQTKSRDQRTKIRTIPTMEAVMRASQARLPARWTITVFSRSPHFELSL